MHAKLTVCQIFTLLMLLTGCGGLASPASTTAPASNGAPAGLGAWSGGLPDNAALARALAAVPPEQQRSGDAYSDSLPHNLVARVAPQAKFFPGGVGNSGSLAQAAYACYAFSLPGYGGAAQAQVRWQSAPPDAARLWLGCADWVRGTWSWRQISSSALQSAAALPAVERCLRYDGALLLAIVALAPSGSQLELAQVSIGIDSTLPEADVTFSVDAGAAGTPISPYVYGANGLPPDAAAHPAFLRSGGNRLTAYNWENNASNAGSDWFHQNDSYLGETDEPGWAMRTFVEAAQTAGAAALVTVPMAGYVAADKLGGGDVNQTADYLNVRFRQSLPRKGAAFAYPPDVTDAFVYQDEFAAWLNGQFGGAAGGASPSIFFSLDNEPDLWNSTHARIHPESVSYAELVQRTLELSAALKDAVPGALVFGPANYGWYGYLTLQDAPDAAALGDFLSYYLDRLQQAELDSSRRLLDVLDVHWYPEAQGGGVRITGDETSPEVVAARLQAPRSLWDPTYTEESWITQHSTFAPIQLLPRLKDKIAAHYPGTKLALTEYCYGAGGHISGGLATADALGAFGREGLFAANLWPLQADSSYAWGALALYTNYDGAGAQFGTASLPLANSDVAGYSAYAARADGGGGLAVLTLVLINKQDHQRLARVRLDNASGQYTLARTYKLQYSSTPERGMDITIAGADFNVSLPPYSATLLEVR